jgi:hypothetical protein
MTVAGRFAPVPPDWPDRQALREGRFRDVEIKHIQSANTHDFIHYMKDPRLHGLLIQRATSPALLTDRALRQAIERFDATGGLPAEQTIAVKVEVEGLNIATNALWPILLDLPGQFV